VKKAFWPTVTVRGDVGWVVIEGGVPMVRVAALLVTEPAVLVTMQRNWSPLMASVLRMRNAAVVVPV
jgi:hypothetical protein